MKLNRTKGLVPTGLGFTEGDLEFTEGKIFALASAALKFPPAVVAIALALHETSVQFDKEQMHTSAEDTTFIIREYEEKDGIWDFKISIEDAFYDTEATYDIRVTRNGDDYESEITTNYH